jgi:hypothetical protein
VILIQEKYFDQSNYDLVAVLNNHGQPGETIEKTLLNDAAVQSLRIENSQIVVEITTSTSTNDPETTYTEITQTFELAGQTLSQVRWASQTQDGKIHTLMLEQPASDGTNSSLLLVQGKLSAPHANIKLIYNLCDQDGNQTYNADSSTTISEAGDFSVSVDLGWVEPGKLRLEVVDFYSSPSLGEDLSQ